jgi:alkaline phosphatase D
VENDYRGTTSGAGLGREAFLKRRAAAYQAYYEHLPLRVRPVSGGLQMYRWRPYGTTADFLVLDSRQYRTAVTMLGAGQEQWLLNRLRTSTARWRVLVEPLFFSRRRFPAGTFSADAWDDHPDERARIVAAARESGRPDLVVISGDVHNNWACEIRADAADPDSPPVGVEFVGTSVTSMPPGTDAPAVMEGNPHIKFFNGQRGYVVCTAGPQEFRTEYRVVDDVTKKDTPVRTAATFLAENGLLRVADV